MEAPAVFWNVTVFILLFINVSTSEEVCDGESFHAQCRTGEVVLMHRALYGRMSLGRCIKEAYGYVGCSVDILAQIDRSCSGNQHCTVLVSSDLTTENPCREDLVSYLDVEYSCVRDPEVLHHIQASSAHVSPLVSTDLILGFAMLVAALLCAI